MDIQLTDEDKAFIDERVRTGTYRSAAAVVEAGLRSLRELEAEQAELRALIRRATRIWLPVATLSMRVPKRSPNRSSPADAPWSAMKRRGIRLTARARDDLTEIYRGLAIKNPPAAERLVRIIAEKIEAIAGLGLTGTAVDEADEQLLMIVVRDHRVYVRVTDSHLIVLGIRHARRLTLPAHLSAMARSEKSEDS